MTSHRKAPVPRATGDRSPRQRLLDAADELFYRHGIRATGVDAVLEHAQVARKTLYHQFGGKDGLIVEYLRERDGRWTDHWSRTIQDAAGPIDRLLAIFDALETWTPSRERSRGCAFVDALVELADPEHPATQVVTGHWDAIEARLTALAEQAGLADPPGAVDDLIVLYRGALTGMMLEPVHLAAGRARSIAADRLAEHAERTKTSRWHGEGGR